MKLIIIRHAETIENKQHIRMGQTDGKLTNEGIEQAQKLSNRLRNEKLDHIYCSDLGRTKETISGIIHDHPQTPIVYERLLREQAHGIYEGLPRKKLIQDRDKSGISVAKFKTDGGENLHDITRRVRKFFNLLQANHANDETILICTHGGWQCAMISHLLNIPFKEELFQFRFSNTSVTILNYQKVGPNEFEMINCTKHLES
ncbi:MAG: histidine phosphatase family protein [bacterium]